MLDIELILRFPSTNQPLFLNFRLFKTNFESEELLSQSLTLRKFQFEDKNQDY